MQKHALYVICWMKRTFFGFIFIPNDIDFWFVFWFCSHQWTIIATSNPLESQEIRIALSFRFECLLLFDLMRDFDIGMRWTNLHFFEFLHTWLLWNVSFKHVFCLEQSIFVTCEKEIIFFEFLCPFTLFPLFHCA